MEFDEIKQIIRQGIPDAQVEITDLTGGNDHLGISVASDLFEGKMLLTQHRMVMDLLKGPLAGDLHAVKIKTTTIKQKRSDHE
ncbi:MAG: BolA/IbaG family iron-sulfur metabolism protein [Halobacteriovoraceae bacterium]|nr:BolA/IbaG family iron-sulfur metabolism protein [Halobacteriovoraceae bacterium]